MNPRKTLIGVIVAVVVVIILGYISSGRTKIVNYPSQGSDIIAFGDSLVYGVGATAGHDFVSLLAKKIGQPIVNLGHSGDTTADGLARIGQLDNFRPKVVILLLGGNDYLKKIPAMETKRNLSLIIENIQARGAVVLLLGVRGGLLSDNFKRMFESLRDSYGTAYVYDVLDNLLLKREYMSDAIHPNDKGYSLITDRVYPVLLKLVR